MDPAGHDVATRVAADREAGVATACLSLSAPLGIEGLRRPEAQPLIDAWHRGVRELPDHFRAWASVPDEDPDIARCGSCWPRTGSSASSCPATDLLTPSAWERAAPLLLAAELAGKPVFVHPGPEPRRVLAGTAAGLVGAGRRLHRPAAGGLVGLARRRRPQPVPRLRLLFAAGAGLAPVHVERHALRGGGRTTVDPTSSSTPRHGARALEAVVRVLGIDALVLGSDRPYGEPLHEFLGDAATHAVRVANPRRLVRAGDRERGVSGHGQWRAEPLARARPC